MLHDFRILDLTETYPGPLATQLLADLGADVIKVERPTGDPMRAASPAVGESSAQFRALNRGKRSVSIDLRTEEGSALVRQLASTVDVVIESYRPGVANRLNIGYEAMRVGHQSLVYVSLSGFGPLSDSPTAAAHDINAMALSGLAAGTASPGGAPRHSPALIADTTLAALTTTAILGANYRVRATGQGCHLKLSLLDSALWVAGIQRAASAAGADVNQGAQVTTGAHAGYGYYICADAKWLAVGALEDHLWRALVSALGLPHIAGDPLDSHAELAATFASEPRHHWLGLLEQLDVCVTPVLHHHEVLAGEAGFGIDESIQAPVHIDNVRPVANRVAPLEIGQDTIAVLREAGVSEYIISKAFAAGAIDSRTVPLRN